MKHSKPPRRVQEREGESGTSALTTEPITTLAADLLVVPVFEEKLETPEIRALDKAVGNLLRDEASRQGFTGKPDESLLFQTHGTLPARNILLAGCGTWSEAATWYQLAETASRTARQVKARTLGVELSRHSAAWVVRILAEGVTLSAYRFVRYRERHDDGPAPALTLRVRAADAARSTALQRAAVTARAACHARDLVNTPAAELTPSALGQAARRLTRLGLRVKIYDKRGIEDLAMGALLGVSRGSAEAPRFIEILYRPSVSPRAKIALVGKGVTFDSGGLSLKTSDSMRIQKRDMAGGAVVLGAMSALPALNLPVEVRGYVPAAENMPDGGAIKPGDVVRAFNGKTIEVLNTDAEGRLLLADALAYAASKRPDVIIDFATLTAAVNSALGSRYAAILGTSRDLIAQCIAAGTEVEERLWELPLVPEYRRDIDSPIADVKNTGEGQAGTIIGGLFLREFVEDIPWAHIDFASTAFTSGYACHPQGATGFGVRLALQYLLKQ